MYSGLQPNTTLWRRMKLPPPGGMDDYMVSEINSAIQLVWDAPEQDDPGGPISWFDVNTAMFFPYDKYIKKQFSAGTSRLTGCTMLIVFNHKAAYIAHYWESLAFATDRSDIAWQTYTTQQEIFKARILDGLEHGADENKQHTQDALKGPNADLLNDADVRAFLIRPSHRHDEDQSQPGPGQGYRNYWDQIEDAVNSYIPELDKKGAEGWVEHVYSPLNEEDLDTEDQLQRTARGRFLFKWDEKHARTKRSLIKLYSESTEVYSEDWPAPIV